MLLAAVAGAGLSLAGVCLQALVRNPLADPYVFGVSAGASLGAVIALTTGGALAAGSAWPVRRSPVRWSASSSCS